jgi:uncharacterized protein YukE
MTVQPGEVENDFRADEVASTQLAGTLHDEASALPVNLKKTCDQMIASMGVRFQGAAATAFKNGVDVMLGKANEACRVALDLSDTVTRSKGTFASGDDDGAQVLNTAISRHLGS